MATADAHPGHLSMYCSRTWYAVLISRGQAYVYRRK